MAVYAVGDVQGCADALEALLDEVGFSPEHDRLWLAGDLVNRGPGSLAVLRRVHGLGEAAVAVLGNHDLHLLAVAAGTREPHRKDTLEAVLTAPDRDPLLHWLRHRPMLHRDAGFTMVHAGLPPQWDIATAQRLAGELEAVLAGDGWREFFAHMYGNAPDRWRDDLTGWERLRVITNALTRLRYCDAQGRMSFKDKGPPGRRDDGRMAWFEVPGRRSRGERILFGHWATLHLAGPVDAAHEVFHLDTGCVWGGRLTALRLDDLRWFSVPCAPALSP